MVIFAEMMSAEEMQAEEAELSLKAFALDHRNCHRTELIVWRQEDIIRPF